MHIEYQLKFHILIIGDEKVGKTAIIKRYFHNQFDTDRKQTIGVEYYNKEKTYGDVDCLFKIWDTAGQEKYASLTKSYYQRADGIVLVCSIDSLQSFLNLQTWLQSITTNTNADDIQLLLIANKCDLEHNREVNTDELELFAKQLGVNVYQSSAKDNINITPAFDHIIDQVYQHSVSKDNKEHPGKFTLDNTGDNQQTKGYCCW